MKTAQGCVVALMPSRLKGGWEMASTAASTIGNCCGRQPAIDGVDRDRLDGGLALSGSEDAEDFEGVAA